MFQVFSERSQFRLALIVLILFRQMETKMEMFQQHSRTIRSDALQHIKRRYSTKNNLQEE